MVGIMAEYFAIKAPGSKIVHDPRLVLNTLDVCEKHGIDAVQSQTGHLFMKNSMRGNNAVYGGNICPSLFQRLLLL